MKVERDTLPTVRAGLADCPYRRSQDRKSYVAFCTFAGMDP